MKLFLDTANFKEIEEINAWGVLDGVTTNPTLLAKEADGKKDYKQMLKEICAEVEGAVSAEVVSTDTEGMLARGARSRSDRRQHLREVPVHRGRSCRVQGGCEPKASELI